MNKTNNAGFTLLELAVVLVIMGILTAAYVTEQGMIQNARLRNALGEVSKYTQAFNNFKDKYHALPGDFANATTYWGTDPAGCPSITTGLPVTPYSTTPKQATCNGNGDGFIGATPLTSVQLDYEEFRAWQQLSDSGLMGGSSNAGYVGMAGSTTNYVTAIPGINVPSSSLNGGGWSIVYLSLPVGGDNNHFTFLNNHYLSLGSTGTDPSFTGTKNSYTNGPLLTPAEALNIDMKLDDGIPGTGNVQPFKSRLNPVCTTSDVAATSQYNVTYGGQACGLLFITNF